MGETRVATRIGGHVVAESLRVLGAEVVFGIPGVHALPMWEGLRASELRTIGFRQELNAAFAADGYARLGGKPAPLVVSTGPGAFMTLGALMEAFTAFVPVVLISSQIRSNAIGKGRGELHETPDQAASFAPLVKWTARAESPEDIPPVLAEAWRRARTPPPGPVYVEVPYDVLRAPAESEVGQLDGAPEPLAPPPASADLDRAAALLAGAERPLLVAGGGAVRSDAGPELLELATRLDAPVATTYTGKGAIPETHPLALGSSWDDEAHREAVARSDVVLVAGSWLGYELADAFRDLPGTLIHIDAAAGRIGIRGPALGLAGDAKAVLEQLLARVEPGSRRGGESRVAAVRERVTRVLDEQAPSVALDLLRIVEDVLPEGAVATWDSTILAYTACWYLRARAPREFLYPAGSSTLGYAWPAALGAASASSGAPVLAIAGDGGFQYGIAELATARQHDLDATLLLIDDGGYGILREYQDEAEFARTGVDLRHPDFAALSDAYGIPVRRSGVDRLPDDLAWALAQAGPSVVVVDEVLRLPVPSAY